MSFSIPPRFGDDVPPWLVEYIKSIASEAASRNRNRNRKPDQLCLEGLDAMSNRTFTAPKGNNVSRENTHMHTIKINFGEFTVDGGEIRKMNDPENFEFLEAIRNYRCPAEFKENGMHTISILVGSGFSNDEPEEGPVDRLAPFRQFE